MPIEGSAAAVIGQHKEECELEERMETENNDKNVHNASEHLQSLQ
jgi:hypothetical protein